MTAIPASAWGHPSRHYSIPVPEHQEREAFLSQGRPGERYRGGVWQTLLQDSRPDLKVSIDRVCKQWNGIVRDYIRTETGLRLSVGDEAQSVPVRVVDGMPWALADVLQRFSDLEWAILNRPLLIAARDGTEFMQALFATAKQKWGDTAGPASWDEIRRVNESAAAWLKALDERKAVDEIVGIQEDVLGAYFFRKSEIQIYWLPIGIVAATLGVSPEALALVVLTHELAHAYTHLGRDIDNERWDTEVFAMTESAIVEGLAQFYTQVICARLESRIPAALAAYKALLEKQSGPYKAHLAWIDDKERGGEIVRVSMIECRSRKLTKAVDFNAAVDRHRLGVKGRKKSDNQPKT